MKILEIKKLHDWTLLLKNNFRVDMKKSPTLIAEFLAPEMNTKFAIFLLQKILEALVPGHLLKCRVIMFLLF